MRGLTIHQPWASLIASGRKQIETRSWYTSYRGLIGIHAASKWNGSMLQWRIKEKTPEAKLLRAELRNGGIDKIENIPLGCIIAIAQLTDVRKMTRTAIDDVSPIERAMGHYEPGRFMWMLRDVKPLQTPIPYKGQQGLWTIPSNILSEEE